MDLWSMFFILFANTILTGLVYYLHAKEEQVNFLSAEAHGQTMRPGGN